MALAFLVVDGNKAVASPRRSNGISHLVGRRFSRFEGSVAIMLGYHDRPLTVILAQPAPGRVHPGNPSMTKDAIADSYSFCWSVMARRCRQYNRQ